MPVARILYYYAHQHFDTGSPKDLVSKIDSLDRARSKPMYLATGEGPLVDALAGRGVEIVHGTVNSVSYRHLVSGMHAVLRQIRMLERLNVDLLHVIDFGWNLDLVLAAWLRRIPIVIQIQNPTTVNFQNLHRYAASKVLICTNGQKSNVVSFHRIAKKCEVLYHLVDLGEFSRGRSIRESLGLSPHDIVVGTIAQICYRKGVDIVLETARLCLPRWNRLYFLLIGPPAAGQESFAHDMMRRAKEYGLNDRVRFLGSRSDIPDLLASIDILLLPSRAEPFGIVIIEAMAAGVPVIASKVGGIPEVISSDEIGHTVTPITAEAFAAALTGILQMPYRSIGERGRRSLMGRFDRATIGAKLQGIYDELLARG